MKHGIGRKIMKVASLACLLSLSVYDSAFAMNLPNALINPYNDSLPDGTITFNSPKTPGTYDTSGDFKVLGGDEIHWISPMSKTGDDYGQYVKEKVQFPDGTEGVAVMFNDALMNNVNNGFTLISTDPVQNDVPDWINMLGGNQDYINYHMNASGFNENGMLKDPLAVALGLPGSQYSVVYAGPIVQWSGGIIKDLGVRVRPDGKTGDRVIRVIPTPPPTASVATDKSQYNQGDTVHISLTVNDYTANQGWQPDTNGPIAQDFHAERLRVKKPDGTYIPLPVTSGSQSFPAATGSNFPFSNKPESGALYPIPGGGSGDPDNPAVYKESATLDTSGLPTGTYVVEFTVSDSVDRQISNGANGTVTATFTIGKQEQVLPPPQIQQGHVKVTIPTTPNGAQAYPVATVDMLPYGKYPIYDWECVSDGDGLGCTWMYVHIGDGSNPHNPGPSPSGDLVPAYLLSDFDLSSSTYPKFVAPPNDQKIAWMKQGLNYYRQMIQKYYVNDRFASVQACRQDPTTGGTPVAVAKAAAQYCTSLTSGTGQYVLFNGPAVQTPTPLDNSVPPEGFLTPSSPMYTHTQGFFVGVGYDNAHSTASGTFPVTIHVKQRRWEVAEYHGGPKAHDGPDGDGKIYAIQPELTINATLNVQGAYYHNRGY